jgi:hypothetical protein
MEVSPVFGLDAGSWEGDVTVDRPIVPSSRPAVGRKRGGYDIDAREFLVSERNAVIRRTLSERVSEFVKRTGGDWDRFSSRVPGSFDYRVDCLAAFVAQTIEYRSRPGDPWQFPDETLALGTGDCEDVAFLLASLILGSGVSGYHVRVALGRVEVANAAVTEQFDHVWVAYKTESGRWSIIDPLVCTKPSPPKKGKKTKRQRPRDTDSPRIRYRPWYVFNDVHLWRVLGDGTGADFSAHVDADFRRSWRRLDPRFAGDIHRTIMQRALEPIVPAESRWVIERVNRQFTRAIGVVGPIVEDIDRDIAGYDPRDHFDNGYITSGWERVNRNLASFNQSNNVNFSRFVRAAHAISDFYAHSTWGHFAREVADPIGRRFHTFDGGSPRSLRASVRYDTPPFDIASGNVFSTNRRFRGTTARAAAVWRGFIISGRYAQEDDTRPDPLSQLTEGITHIPPNLRAQSDYAKRLGLPHHEEIAVDSATRHDGHKLYAPNEYVRQFVLRRNTAIRHIRQAFIANWNGALRRE